ncbi:hypothetical protein [Paraburkholderia caribensis]|uniref:hypothetical protein n=1 Tax=Paraburkholderia caribensis TaxID=75105 RepID=UPI00285CCD5D|nr:hypothetical protein [Paraburkholderia caribensis]MDR6384957.1 hypothetical protein [Paraburkholderia caribensis]
MSTHPEQSGDVFVGPLLPGKGRTQIICVSHRALTVDDYEHAARVVLRDAELIRFEVGARLREIRELDARGHALLRDASGLAASAMLVAQHEAMQAYQ